MLRKEMAYMATIDLTELSEQLPSTKAKRALIYDRVSTGMQAKSGYSAGADGFQVQGCLECAQRHLPGVAFIREPIEDVDSGAEWELEGILEALRLAKARAYDVLLVWNTDRFARNTVKRAVYTAELERHGVRVVFVQLPVDDSPEGRLLVNMKSSIDEYEREIIKLRTRMGALQKARRGLYVGKGYCPFGYRYITQWSEMKRREVPVGLEPHPTTAPILRRMYDDACSLTLLEIAAWLTAERVPTPTGRRGAWGYSSVRLILKNPLYKGSARYADVTIPVPPLVDDDTWAWAQRCMTDRRKIRRGRSQADAWELRGLLTCGYCGGALSTSSNWGKADALTRRYTCLRGIRFRTESYGWEPCPMKDFDAETLERAAWEKVALTLLDPEKLRTALEAHRQQHQDERDVRRTRLGILDDEIKKWERTLRRLADELLGVERDDERYGMYKEREVQAAQTLKQLREERLTMESAPLSGLSDDALHALERWSERVRAGIAKASTRPEARRWVFQTLQLRGTIRYGTDGQGRKIGRKWYDVEWSAAIRLLDSDHSKVEEWLQ
jgi:DNA invertase Pin-like site-specific DNA recombinase